MRYPLSTLAEAAGLSEAALARAVGLSGSTLKAARSRGLLEEAADRYACRVGLVPWLVWPEWACQPCALEDCGVKFRPHRPGHVYHDRKCARKAWARTEAGKRSLAAAKRRWLETAWEYDRARERDRKRRLRAEQKSAGASRGPQTTDGTVAA